MAAQNRAALSALIDGNLGDNTSGAITPADVREVLDAMTESSANLVDDPSLNRLPEVIKTADYTLAATDAGKMMVANKATAITFGLPAVAGSSSEAYLVRNIGAGLLTVDPNSTEQIEGASTLTLATGESALIWPNSGKTAWRASTWLSPNGVVRDDRLIVADPADATKQARLDAGNVTAGQTRVLKAPDRDGTLVVDGIFGRCSLVKDGSDIRLNPCDGNLITTGAGVILAVPSGGVALAPTGLSASTDYFIYARDSDGDGVVDVLEASATAPVQSSTNGVMVKTSASERVLVGLAGTTAATAWADSTTQRLVCSYFNRVAKTMERAFTADRTTTSTSYVEINSEIRLEFLAWGDEALTFGCYGVVGQSSDTEAVYTRIEIDSVGSGAFFTQSGVAPRNGYPGPLNLSGNIAPSRGRHYVTLSGRVSGATGKWWQSSADLRVFLTGLVKG